MPSEAIAGVGTSLYRGTVTALNKIAEVNSISGPNSSRSQIDVTSLDSTGGYREFIGGFRDGGEVTLNMNFTPATYGLMQNDFESDVNQTYIIVMPNAAATQISFSAFVQSVGFAVSADDKITSDVTLKVSGVPTITT